MTLVVRRPAPEVVKPLQLRRALRSQGLTAAVEAYVANQPADVIEDWEYAVEIRRLDPMIDAARIALGLTEADRDDLFRLAATL